MISGDESRFNSAVWKTFEISFTEGMPLDEVDNVVLLLAIDHVQLLSFMAWLKPSDEIHSRNVGVAWAVRSCSTISRRGVNRTRGRCWCIFATFDTYSYEISTCLTQICSLCMCIGEMRSNCATCCLQDLPLRHRNLH